VVIEADLPELDGRNVAGRFERAPTFDLADEREKRRTGEALRV
jgi:hypothetical protein